jgi:hypothetical protein
VELENNAPSRLLRFWSNLEREGKVELIFYILWPAFTVLIARIADLNYLSLILLSFGIPSAVLLRELSERKHFLYFTTVFSVALSPFIDYIAHASDLWWIKTTLPRIWHYVPVESFLWGFFMTFYAVGFYERYFRKNNHQGFRKYFYPLHILAAASFLIIPFESLLPKTLYLPHLYLIGMTIIFLLPLAEYLHLDNANHRGLWLTSFYFYYTNAMHEVAALLNNIWKFPIGENTAVLGTFNFLNHKIPFEEVTLYFGLLAPALIAYYELLSRREH